MQQRRILRYRLLPALVILFTAAVFELLERFLEVMLGLQAAQQYF